MDCVEYRKQYYEANRDKLLAYQRWYYQKVKKYKVTKKANEVPITNYDPKKGPYVLKGTFICTFD